MDRYKRVVNVILSTVQGKIRALEDNLSKVENIHLQANIAAATLLCSLFTMYIFLLDMFSLHTEGHADLPLYFRSKSYVLFWITAIFSPLSLLFDLGGIIIGLLCCKQIYAHYIILCMLSCIGSTLLQLSFHFQISWSTNPLELLYIMELLFSVTSLASSLHTAYQYR